MANKWTITLFLVGFLWLLPAGFGGQAAAADSVAEMIGDVEHKIRAGTPDAVGKTSPRADQAVAILVDGLRMLIAPEAVVKNSDGSSSDFNQLAVPCRARIVYRRLEDGNRSVLELHIRQLAQNATPVWPASEPQ